MSRRLLGLGLLCSAGALAAVVSAPARADAPQRQGWWNAADPGVSGAPFPAPPDVPPDGLLVQGGPNGSPTAYAAVLYDVADGATVGRLALTVAPQPAVTTASATLELCPLVNPTIHAEQGGPMTDAPDYDCTHRLTAQLDSGGSRFDFDVSPLASNGALAVAILPGDVTSRVVLSKPDSSSLQVTPAVPASPPLFESSPARTGSTSGTGAGTSVSSALPPVSSVPTVGDARTPVVAPPGASAASAAPASPVSTSPVAATSTTAGKATPGSTGLLVAGLLAGAGLWAFAGRAAPDNGGA